MDSEGFKKMFLSSGKRFYVTAFRMLGDEAEAEDAVQDVFVKLWGMRESLAGVRNPEAFGVTMTRNVCIDRLRSSARKNTDSVNAKRCEISGADEEPAIDDKAKIRRIKELLEELPERQKRVFELRYFSDCSQKEIESITGLGAVNVRVLLSRTRKMLAERLEKEFAI